MAVAIVHRPRTAIVASKRKMRTLTDLMEDIPFELSSRLPTDKKLDVELGTLLNAEWQKRRVVCTKTEVYFALVGEDLVRDRIPLEEITAVEVMGEVKELEALLSSLRESRPEHRLGEMISREMDTSLSFMFLNVFQIRFNSGRTYYLQAEGHRIEDIVRDLRKLVEAARSNAEGVYKFRKCQKIIQTIYESAPFQTASACLIVAVSSMLVHRFDSCLTFLCTSQNFAMSIYEAQVGVISNPSSQQEDLVNTMELLFVFAFTTELIFNAFANWLMPFIQNPWSMFDVVIVSILLVGLTPVGLPLNLLLLFRSWRVLRIFGKVKSVSKIFFALSYSVVPMTNAFFIIFIIAAIYAIIGVTFFFADAPDEFGTFCRAFVAMFRITIGSVEWWYGYFPATSASGNVNFWPSFFLITYVIIVDWVFFQVSIAVLLDNFLAASREIKMEEKVKMIQAKQGEKQFKNPLDPLLLRLSKDYLNDTDLSARLQELFKVLDSDGSGDLSSQEFQAAMKKLDVTPRIFLSDSDFIAMTRNGALCDSNGRLRAQQFEIVMREQMRLYTQSRLSSTSEFWTTSDQDFTPIGTLKQILMEQLRTKSEQDAALNEVKMLLMAMQSGPGLAAPESIKLASATPSCGVNLNEEEENKTARTYIVARCRKPSAPAKSAHESIAHSEEMNDAGKVPYARQETTAAALEALRGELRGFYEALRIEMRALADLVVAPSRDQRASLAVASGTTSKKQLQPHKARQMVLSPSSVSKTSKGSQRWTRLSPKGSGSGSPGPRCEGPSPRGTHRRRSSLADPRCASDSGLLAVGCCVQEDTCDKEQAGARGSCLDHPLAAAPSFISPGFLPRPNPLSSANLEDISDFGAKGQSTQIVSTSAGERSQKPLPKPTSVIRSGSRSAECIARRTVSPPTQDDAHVCTCGGGTQAHAFQEHSQATTGTTMAFASLGLSVGNKAAGFRAQEDCWSVGALRDELVAGRGRGWLGAHRGASRASWPHRGLASWAPLAPPLCSPESLRPPLIWELSQGQDGPPCSNKKHSHTLDKDCAPSTKGGGVERRMAGKGESQVGRCDGGASYSVRADLVMCPALPVSSPSSTYPPSTGPGALPDRPSL